MKMFRADIQGLRAIAVMLVVLFHFEPAWLPGGFIGVDIFFVISGYLMTSIVVTGVQSGKFTLSAFYIARVVRIIPALLVLCVTVTVLGFIFLNLVDASKVASNSLNSLLFISNIAYWTESGYFDDASKSNWLLHTWSLSVEWQFYILYPIFILLLSKLFSIRMLAWLTLLGVVLGFFFSVWASNTMPSAAYFLLPTRAWELLIGGLAFFFPLSSAISVFSRNLIEAAGISLIILSAFLLSENYAWPGIYASVPVLATLMVLLANNQSFLTNNIVSQKIGTWSYSIYLWHWPLVVLISYFGLPSFSWLWGIGLTFMFGWLSFTFCESKFSKKAIPKKQRGPKTVLVALTLICSTLLVFVYSKDSIWQQNIDEVEPFLAGQMFFDDSAVKNATGGETYFFNGANENDFDFLAIGDSNLSHYAYGIAHSRTPKVILSWDGLCLSLPNYMTKPTESYMNANWQNFCENNYKKIYQYSHKPIILAHQWEKRQLLCIAEPCSIEPNKSNYFSLLESQLNALISMVDENRQIVIVGQIPAPSSSVYQCMKGLYPSGCQQYSDEHKNERLEVNKLLFKVSSLHSNVIFIDPYKLTCDENYKCRNVINGKSLFHDEGHFSAFGSRLFWDYIYAQIRESI